MIADTIFLGGGCSVSNQSDHLAFAKAVKEQAPALAARYRICIEKNGEICFYPAEDEPPFSLSPFQFPLVASGQFSVAYYDAKLQLLSSPPVQVEWIFPTKSQVSQPTQTAVSRRALRQEAGEVAHSLEMERIGNETSTMRGNAKLIADNLVLYSAFNHAMGTQSARELYIKNEQLDLYARAAKSLLETQVELMETFKQHAESLRTPPPPPQWDKIVLAGAPALASIIKDIIQAATGRTQPSTSAATIEPHSSEKVSHLYELLGTVGTTDRLTVMLQDPEKLQAWLDSVRSALDKQAKPDRPKTGESAPE